MPPALALLLILPRSNADFRLLRASQSVPISAAAQGSARIWALRLAAVDRRIALIDRLAGAIVDTCQWCSERADRWLRNGGKAAGYGWSVGQARSASR